MLVLWQLFQNYVASFAQWRSTHGAFAVYLIIVCIGPTLFLLWRQLPARGAIACIAILSLVIWAVVGDPVQTVGNWVWHDGLLSVDG